MKKLFILIAILFVISACAGLQIGPKDPNEIARAVGAETSFWILQNNLEDLDAWQDGLDRTKVICEPGNTIDVIDFANSIINFANMILADEKYSGDIENIQVVLKRLKLYVNMTYESSGDYDEVKAYICSFLEGVQESVTALR